MDQEAHRVIKLYKENLEKQGIHIKKIILFGSYAHGHQTEYSDIVYYN